MKGIQDTNSSTLRQLLGNGMTYQIPKFQRDYSWGSEQWDDLWQDMHQVVSGLEPGHYLGYLVLQTKNDKDFKVIDGQQRLTTLSILILAVINSLKVLVEDGQDAENNKRRIDSFRNSYIGYLDPVTLIAKNKLSLNRNNDDFYRLKLVPLEPLPQRGMNASERLMKDCFHWFAERLKAEYSNGKELAAFLDLVVDKLFFTVISVNDELNAFKVFETLNARGVQLSASDLLKNYLFSVVDSEGAHKSEMTEIESAWRRVVQKLGKERVAVFLRVYWNSQFKTVRKNDLFKAMRTHVKDKKGVFHMLRELDQCADIFMALKNPDDEFWNGDKAIRRDLQALKIFQVRQPFSVLIAAYECLDLARFKHLLKDVVALSFRYNVIGGFNPNDQETVYNELARSLHDDKQYDQAILAKINPDDETFEVNFSNAEFARTARSHKVARYILSKIERKLYAADIDLSSDLYTLEHIMPEHHSDDWLHIPDDVYESSIFRLGNLTLLEKNLNQASATDAYNAKKEVFRKSSLNITKAIPDRYETWGEEQINTRQRQLAKQAKQIWVL